VRRLFNSSERARTRASPTTHHARARTALRTHTHCAAADAAAAARPAEPSAADGPGAPARRSASPPARRDGRAADGDFADCEAGCGGGGGRLGESGRGLLDKPPAGPAPDGLLPAVRRRAAAVGQVGLLLFAVTALLRGQLLPSRPAVAARVEWEEPLPMGPYGNWSGVPPQRVRAR
jgi:hypothetical protein